MNKISTLSTLAHLCLWQSQRQDFPNSSHGQKKAELKEARGSEEPPFIPQTNAKTHAHTVFVSSRFGGGSVARCALVFALIAVVAHECVRFVESVG